jgi:signal transduction histidine kinase
MKAGGAAAAEDDRERQALLADLRMILDEAIHTTRSLTFDLGSPRPQPLEPALRELTGRFQSRCGLQVTFEAHGLPASISGETDALLCEAVNELLLNAVKHAGVDCAVVSAKGSPVRVHVSVADEGRGFDPAVLAAGLQPSGGFGLVRLRERLLELGGSLRVESAPSRGTAVHLELPLPQEEPA